MKVLVTGGSGFLGKHVVRRFKRAGYDVFAPSHENMDVTSSGDIGFALLGYHPDIVIHLAAEVGGIGANIDNPVKFFEDNMLMGMNILKTSINTKKVVMVGTTCSYPEHCPVPFKESDLWSGHPEPTNAPYGIAKRSLIELADAYRRQYEVNVICPVLANLYGPGDNFDYRTSHVVPAIIRRFVENGDRLLWGTGIATRDLLYVKDAADALLWLVENYNEPDPINIGTGKEVGIKHLAEAMAELTGYDKPVKWDMTSPDGQIRRCLDVTRARNLGWQAKTSLIDGLKETIRWYENHA